MSRRGESLYGPGKHAYFVVCKDSEMCNQTAVILKAKNITMECCKSSPSVCVWHIKGDSTEAEEILRGMQREGTIQCYAEDDVPL